MEILISIACIVFFFIGIVLGAWFTSFTKVSDLRNQNAQLKATVDRLQDIVKYYEEKEEKMKETATKITLRDFLEKFGFDRGSDTGIVIYDGNIEMQVSYRYLDCPAWKYLLDKFVYKYYVVEGMHGRHALKIIVVSEDEL